MNELGSASLPGTIDFFHALLSPQLAFLRRAALAGALASIAFGITGTYVTSRRIASLAGAISHAVLAGIGAALYFSARFQLSGLSPLTGAVLSAVMAALVIGLVSLYVRQREDTVIGAIWAVGMAVGLLFLAKTPGPVDAMSYLFGNILLITSADLWLVVGLDIVVVVVGVLFFPKLQAVCFDEEFARLRGVRTEVYYLLLLILTALTVVVLMRVVGLVMVIAMLTLPAATAGYFTRRMAPMMVLAAGWCLLFTGVGLEVSYVFDLPSGPTIIVIAGLVYLTTAAGAWFRKARPGRRISSI